MSQGEDCGCKAPVPGVDFPFGTNTNDTQDWEYCVVERCDECDIFESDEAGCVALCEKLNVLNLLGPHQKFVAVEVCGPRGEGTFDTVLGILTSSVTVELVNCRSANEFRKRLVEVNKR
jgi:hypothetical protein